jgi:hypothetical protein
MIVPIGLIAIYLSLLVWLFLYPILFANFVLGGELRSNFSAGHILFGSGAVLWAASLYLGIHNPETDSR